MESESEALLIAAGVVPAERCVFISECMNGLTGSDSTMHGISYILVLHSRKSPCCLMLRCYNECVNHVIYYFHMNSYHAVADIIIITGLRILPYILQD